MISRRAFLARSAASAAAFTIIPSRLVGANGSRSPNSRLALAGVGVGGVGFGQLQECAEACRGGEPAGCNFNWAEPLTEIVLLGNIAIRTGKLLEWDAAQGNFTNSPDANRQLHDDYQNGWSLEAV
jgi:hypothetical protein